MTKRYKLLKDLPGQKAGTVYVQHKASANRYYPEKEYENGSLIQDSQSIYGLLASDMQSKEWFDPLPDGIEILDFYLGSSNYDNNTNLIQCAFYSLKTNILIPKEKLPAIRNAIEFILNNDQQ